MLRPVAKTMCCRIQLTMSCADPEGGSRGSGPPSKIMKYIGLYRIRQLDPQPEPPGNVGQLSPWNIGNYSLMIAFFEDCHHSTPYVK